jgi:broad specificity phosphatase PhoE
MANDALSLQVGRASLGISKMFYFIRHAEGEANVSQRHLGKDSPLTEVGRQQAVLLAKRCVSLRPQALLTLPCFSSS